MDIATGSTQTFKAQDYSGNATSVISNPILFNIIHIENITVSRLNQIEDWQQYLDPYNVSVDRVNRSKRIIREVPIPEEGGVNNDSLNSPFVQPEVYKLLLRDFANNYCYAYEYNEPLRFIRDSQDVTFTPLKIKLGGRLRVQAGTRVVNGVLYLSNSNCQYLGLIDQDKELTENLNSGIVQRYIEILTEGLKS